MSTSATLLRIVLQSTCDRRATSTTRLGNLWALDVAGIHTTSLIPDLWPSWLRMMGTGAQHYLDDCRLALLLQNLFEVVIKR